MIGQEVILKIVVVENAQPDRLKTEDGKGQQGERRDDERAALALAQRQPAKPARPQITSRRGHNCWRSRPSLRATRIHCQAKSDGATRSASHWRHISSAKGSVPWPAGQSSSGGKPVGRTRSVSSPASASI